MSEKKTLAFTGLRPHKLPFGFDERHSSCVALKNCLAGQMVRMIEIEGVDHFISGMAMGIDMICAELVLELKTTYPHITLLAAIPCNDQDILWPHQYRQRYRDILAQCDDKHVECESYTDDCMMRRNRFMVNQSDYLIAVWNGAPGGTSSTISFARKMKRKIILIHPSTLTVSEE